MSHSNPLRGSLNHIKNTLKLPGWRLTSSHKHIICACVLAVVILGRGHRLVAGAHQHPRHSCGRSHISPGVGSDALSVNARLSQTCMALFRRLHSLKLFLSKFRAEVRLKRNIMLLIISHNRPTPYLFWCEQNKVCFLSF